MTRSNLSGFNLVSYVMKMKAKFNNFLMNDIVDEDVETIIMDSWIRSKEKNVNPYDAYGVEITSIEEANEKKLTPEELQTAFGSVIPLIEEVMSERQLSLLLFDSNGKNIRLSIFSAFDPYKAINDSDSEFLGDLTEGVIGTNAVCLALQHDMPVQIIGPEHYNVHLHNFFLLRRTHT